MNSKEFKIIASIVMIAFLFSTSTTGFATGNPVYNQSNSIVNVTTNQGSISVTGNGNVPFFHIQLNSSSTAYEVKFVSLQEFVDKNNNGQFDQSESVPASINSLAAVSWNFSGFKTITSTSDSNSTVQKIDFNFTSTTSSPSIQLRTHIDLSQGNQLKFDLVISNYTWKSSDSAAMLAVKFQIAGGNLTGSGNTLEFGNAKFSTVSSATTSSGNINVSTQIDTGSTFYLLFNHFSNGFELDPTFSVSSSNSTPGFEILPLAGGLMIVAIVVLKNKKSI